MKNNGSNSDTDKRSYNGARGGRAGAGSARGRMDSNRQAGPAQNQTDSNRRTGSTRGRMDANHRSRQAIAVAVIVLVGVLLSALILTGTAPDGSEAAHGAHGHAPQQRDGKQDHARERQQEGRDGFAGTREPGKNGAAHVHDSHRKIAFTEAQIEATGITLARAGPARIRDAIQLPGEIVFDAHRTTQLAPRLAGVVQAVEAELGQEVRQGEVLAVIASPELSERRHTLKTAQQRLSLARSTYERERLLWKEKVSAEQDYLQARRQLQEAQIAVADALEQLQALGTDAGRPGSANRLEIRAPFDGTIIERNIALGEMVAADAPVFKISDLSTVWADIIVPAEALGAVRVGGKARVEASAFDSHAEGAIFYVGSLLGGRDRSATARVSLPNPDRAWRPGLYVNVRVFSKEVEAPVAVSPQAVHTLEGESVVFVWRGNEFIAQAVATGRRDADAVEILDGLPANTRYAARNSFVIKSELGKGSASHSH